MYTRICMNYMINELIFDICYKSMYLDTKPVNRVCAPLRIALIPRWVTSQQAAHGLATCALNKLIQIACMALCDTACPQLLLKIKGGCWRRAH